MSDDTTFRIVVITIVVCVLPVGLYHRARSQATREKLDRRQEGTFILATLRPAGAIYWFGVIAWMINPQWMAWSAMPLPIWMRWLGVGVVVSAAALVVWTFRTLGPNLTDTVVTRQKHTLVVGGPYRWIRHPFYVCAGSLTMGLAMVAANWFLVVIGLIVFALIVARTTTEERNLVARFGSDYETYMQRTGRFLPRIF